jgi:hypothetical protein
VVAALFAADWSALLLRVAAVCDWPALVSDMPPPQAVRRTAALQHSMALIRTSEAKVTSFFI